MSVESIISDLKKKKFKPVYWLEGEEPFFIDEIMNYAEHQILKESEASFNLSIFYGKDTHWADVVNACRRYPMFSEVQVVLLKEAQQMKDLEQLESYIENPLSSTLLVVSYKEKKLDARTKFAKTIKTKGELFSTKKIYENQLPEWINSLVKQHQLSITQKATLLLCENIGNDLSRIKNEIEKIAVNLKDTNAISDEVIEKYVGVSKEYNVFELQDAIAKKNLSKAIRIIQYFEKNPKAAPIQLVLPSLYSFFSKVFLIFSANGGDDKSIAASLGINPYFMKDYLLASKNYRYEGVEKILLLLHQYNLRSIGINDNNTNDAELLKEFVVKVIAL
ncbi:MAG: DNA polymerase III subunit delta [Chitinophagaceae bacterium]|nr:DNA polymerase III subunit delta [Chitinophagaceae bacterium]